MAAISTGSGPSGLDGDAAIHPGCPVISPSKRNRVVQVKYTNPVSARAPLSDRKVGREKVTFGLESMDAGYQPCHPTDLGLSLSGSDQAREGRLVNALAARGDERRDTLR